MIEKEIKLKLSYNEIDSLINKLNSLKATKEFCKKQTTYRFDTKEEILRKKVYS